ncbi:MAG: hypothetical protein ABIU84_14780, partial [Thermoanaerobaculia bacterium]
MNAKYRFFQRLSIPLCLLLGLAAARAGAQNLLMNPDFDDGLTGWQVSFGGNWSAQADSGGCLLSNAVGGTSTPGGGGDPIMGLYGQQCIAVDPLATPTLYLGGMYQTAADVYARFYVEFFSDAICNTFSGWSATAAGGTSVAWNRVMNPLAIPLEANSLTFWVDIIPATSGAPPFAAAIDRLYLGVEPQLFLNSFEEESGTTCYWSNVVGEN